jgi:hypothetical protein
MQCVFGFFGKKARAARKCRVPVSGGEHLERRGATGAARRPETAGWEIQRWQRGQ